MATRVVDLRVRRGVLSSFAACISNTPDGRRLNATLPTGAGIGDYLRTGFADEAGSYWKVEEATPEGDRFKIRAIAITVPSAN